MAYQAYTLGILGHTSCRRTLVGWKSSDVWLLLGLHAGGLGIRSLGPDDRVRLTLAGRAFSEVWLSLFLLHLFPFHDTRKFGPRRITLVRRRVQARLPMPTSGHDCVPSGVLTLPSDRPWR